MKAPDLSTSQMKTVAFIVIGLIILFLVFLAFRKLGLIGKTSHDKLNDNEALTPVTDSSQPSKLMSDSSVTSKIKTIYENLHVAFVVPFFSKLLKYHGESDDKVISVFKTLQNKVQSGQLADMFQKTYGTDLASFLNTYMTSDDVATINSILSKLPD